MKRTQKFLLTTLAVVLTVFLIGCGGSDDAAESASSEGAETSGSEDATSRPTQMSAVDDDLQEALGPDGAWIVIWTDDTTLSEEITVSGEVYQEEGDDAPRRKLALYAQDSDRNVTDRYTLTVPRLVVEHENTLIQSGEVAGDVYVDAEGFELSGGATINGNVYFADEALEDSASISDDSTIIGEIRTGTVADAVSRPTEMTATDADNLQEAVGPDGSWIVLFEDDVTVDEDVTVFGAVYEEEGADAPRRKLALYTQDSDRNVTDRFTLTVPRLVVHHMNTLIQSGTVAGDVYVEEEGFELSGGATIDGDLYFATEELQESASISDDSEVTGSVEIGTID
ncbi:MAG: hypothetical protein ACOCYB_07075 [Alkalispirochaeta sp.]